jgi:F0F1-type ATP synthase assembly protein I
MLRRTQSQSDRETQRAWRLSSMGGELAFGMIGMVLLGWGIDDLLGSKPIAIITCTIVGVIGSGYNFIRQALVISKQSAKKLEKKADAGLLDDGPEADNRGR